MAILGLKDTAGNENSKKALHFPSSKNALIIFTRNPELGKCKTRLAATVGDQNALAIYKFLLAHTVKITRNLSADIYVYYSEQIRDTDSWDNSIYRKKQQHGENLGIRMHNAFTEVFNMGYTRAIIIGSDMYDMTTQDIEHAFTAFDKNDFILGPAEDGGYYLLGMKTVKPSLFKNKIWGTETVLNKTLEDLKLEKVGLLTEKNDVDYYEDIKDIDVFQKFLIHLKD
ncbi:MAG: rSAM/selenodomain-associated transferase 1 [Patiriisocius sp.]|jgi:rSAM/selenodomain-associated transferase 1